MAAKKTVPAKKVAHKPAAKAAAPAKKAAPKAAPAAEVEEAEEGPGRARGPRGVGEDAVIHLLVDDNPKREGSKSAAAFSNYVDGMTVGQFCDAVGKEATANLVWDASHGFISIYGYEPGEPRKAKPKAPAAPAPAPAAPAKPARRGKAAPVDPEDD